MKKSLCLLAMCCFLAGCSQSGKNNKKPIVLNAKEVVARLQDQKTDTFLLNITTDDCYSCDEYDKVVDEMEKENGFEIYILKIDLNENDEDILEALNELEVTVGEYDTFPMTYYFYKGNLQPENIKTGYIEKKDYVTWLNNLHIY